MSPRPRPSMDVQVREPVSRRAENLIQADVVLASALLALFLVELGDEVRLVVALPDARLEAVHQPKVVALAGVHGSSGSSPLM